MANGCKYIKYKYNLLFTGYYEDITKKTTLYNYIFMQILLTIYKYNNHCKRLEKDMSSVILKYKIVGDIKLLSLIIKEYELTQHLNNFIQSFMLQYLPN